jgi:hypothetical protein
VKLNAPLVVPTERGLSSGAVSLGITEIVPQGEESRTKVRCIYVRVWQPGQTDRGSLKSTPPKLVLYSAYNSRGYAGYAAPVPALLCSSLAAAAEVYALCEGYAKCAHCESPFTPTRKDQTCCTPQHSALKRVERKRRLDRAVAQRRKSSR